MTGHTWTFFDIDYNGSTGGNGQLLEVGPDELIYFYDFPGGSTSTTMKRIQRFKVTADDVLPMAYV